MEHDTSQEILDEVREMEKKVLELFIRNRTCKELEVTCDACPLCENGCTCCRWETEEEVTNAACKLYESRYGTDALFTLLLE